MFYKLFLDGQQKMLDEADAQEHTKAGTLRAGNSSLLADTGELIGSCANLTYLRYKGIQVEKVDSSRDLMFDAGRRNEDHWADVLAKSWDGKILRESDIPIKWFTENGTEVTGRPDLVLCDHEGKPVRGLELKLVSSMWTARDVKFQKKPKLAHLMQSAHYSWKLGVPFELWYTARADYAVTGDWIKNLFPAPGAEGSEACQYAYYKFGKHNPKTGKPVKSRINEDEYMRAKANDPSSVTSEILKILPFIQGYIITIKDKQVFYRDAMVPNAPEHETIININMIKNYYERITEMEKMNVVQKEPLLLDATGEKLNYTAQQYCSLGDLCCGKCSGQKLDKWVEQVKEKVADKAKKD